jgi:hypothetical protein
MATLQAGQSLILSAADGEVVSVQNDFDAFAYTVELNVGPPPTTTIPGPPACTDPLTCDVVTSIRARWRCDTPGCTLGDWIGGVIAWPEWSAYESNARTGSQSRTVYADTGEMLYPYMGAWADGCTIEAVFDTVLIIEWERGTNIWRATYLSPGQSHTIDLVSPEDNVLLETPDTPTTFGVRITNCTPQVIDKS